MPERLSRRRFLASLSGLAAVPALSRPALAQSMLDGADFGILAGSFEDQSAQVQAALDAASEQGRTLALPPGEIFVGNVDIPGRLRIVGSPGRTILMTTGGAPIATAYAANDLTIEGVTFAAPFAGPAGSDRGLLEIDTSAGVRIVDCTFTDGRCNGIAAINSAVTIEDCDFTAFGEGAIFSIDSRGLMISGNRISNCANAGIRIWRGEAGLDGSIIAGNRIETIGWSGGGNGQNGNGVNVFRAGGVIVSDNVISGCAFSAVRLNASTDSTVRGNVCFQSGEVAIFSEFGFSGSVISDNIIDGAAGGISITNLDEGGRIATCSGNIVRNIAARSETNPDTRPFGIYAEAETVVSGNTIDAVPGIGFWAGYGTFLRNVIIADNVAYAVHVGIAVSVVENPAPGTVVISGNLVDAPLDFGIVGMRWDERVSDDLVADAARFPHVHLFNNVVTPG